MAIEKYQNAVGSRWFQLRVELVTCTSIIVTTFGEYDFIFSLFTDNIVDLLQQTEENTSEALVGDEYAPYVVDQFEQGERLQVSHIRLRRVTLGGGVLGKHVMN
jgi:hypothetical protein